MINNKLKHLVLRLDLLQEKTSNDYPNKLFYCFTNDEDSPTIFSYEEFNNQIVIEKDIESKVLLFDNRFFEDIKYLYQIWSLPCEDEFFKNDLKTNFFQVNEKIGEQEFNPSEFGNGMQIKIADEYAHLLWNLIIN